MRRPARPWIPAGRLWLAMCWSITSPRPTTARPWGCSARCSTTLRTSPGRAPHGSGPPPAAARSTRPPPPGGHPITMTSGPCGARCPSRCASDLDCPKSKPCASRRSPGWRCVLTMPKPQPPPRVGPSRRLHRLLRPPPRRMPLLLSPGQARRRQGARLRRRYQSLLHSQLLRRHGRQLRSRKRPPTGRPLPSRRQPRQPRIVSRSSAPLARRRPNAPRGSGGPRCRDHRIARPNRSAGSNPPGSSRGCWLRSSCSVRSSGRSPFSAGSSPADGAARLTQARGRLLGPSASSMCRV